jgi:phage repressor protein C with HTH and peptisase S24 domain
MDLLGFNQTDLAKSLNVSRGVISEFSAGAREPSKEFLLGISNLGVSTDWFLTGEGSPFRSLDGIPPAAGSGPQANTQALAPLDKGGAVRPVGEASTAVAKTYAVPLLKQKVSCGPGVDWETDADNIETVIEIDALIPNLGLGRVFATQAHGSSMIGAGIKGGDYLFFDASSDVVPQDGVYVFVLDGEVYCKRLEFEKLARKINIFSMRTPEIEKAELLFSLSTSDNDFSDRFRIFGRVIRLLRKFEKEK